MKNFINLSKVKEKISSLYKSNKKIFFASIICIVIIVFLFTSSMKSLNSKKNKNNSVNIEKAFSVTEYADSIENKIVNIVSKLNSVKNVSAFVMVETTPTITYLTEKKETTVKNDDGTKTELVTTVVFEKNGSITTPVVVTTLMPKITGVLIVTNKINASTKLSIISSISIVLNVDESCISLLQES